MESPSPSPEVLLSGGSGFPLVCHFYRQRAQSSESVGKGDHVCSLTFAAWPKTEPSSVCFLLQCRRWGGGLPRGSEGKTDAVLLQRRATWWWHGAGGSKNPPHHPLRGSHLQRQGCAGTRVAAVHSTSPRPLLAPGAAPGADGGILSVVPAPSEVAHTSTPRSTLELNHLPHHLLPAYSRSSHCLLHSFSAKYRRGPQIINICLRNRSRPVICAGLVEGGGFQDADLQCMQVSAGPRSLHLLPGTGAGQTRCGASLPARV